MHISLIRIVVGFTLFLVSTIGMAEPKAMLFVSFSMPSTLMKDYMRQTPHYGIPLVIRGLKDNDFRKTAEMIYEIGRENTKAGFLINPLWFKKFNIKQVPALVVGTPEKFDVITGNLSIETALSRMQGGVRDEWVKALLGKGERHA